jgi:hypothetical protein
VSKASQRLKRKKLKTQTRPRTEETEEGRRERREFAENVWAEAAATWIWFGPESLELRSGRARWNNSPDAVGRGEGGSQAN